MNRNRKVFQKPRFGAGTHGNVHGKFFWLFPVEEQLLTRFARSEFLFHVFKPLASVEASFEPARIRSRIFLPSDEELAFFIGNSPFEV